jgi:hypothetical protein
MRCPPLDETIIINAESGFSFHHKKITAIATLGIARKG